MDTYDAQNFLDKNIKFRDWQFRIKGDGIFPAPLWLQIMAPKEPDNRTGEPRGWFGRKWRISRQATKSELVQTCLLAVLTALEHEAREQFMYRGRPIFDGHYDVDKLWRLRKEKTDESALDVRVPAD